LAVTTICRACESDRKETIAVACHGVAGTHLLLLYLLLLLQVCRLLHRLCPLLLLRLLLLLLRLCRCWR
jgi:hypothetical protein